MLPPPPPPPGASLCPGEVFAPLVPLAKTAPLPETASAIRMTKPPPTPPAPAPLLLPSPAPPPPPKYRLDEILGVRERPPSPPRSRRKLPLQAAPPGANVRAFWLLAA